MERLDTAEEAASQTGSTDPASERRLRIAVVTETYPPEINGVARTVGLTVDWLLRRGHEVDLVRPRQQREPALAPHPHMSETLTVGLRVPQWNVQLGFSLRRTLRARWRLKRPDVVHVVAEGPLGWAAVAAARGLRVPISSDFHTNFHSYSAHYGVGWLEGTVAGYLRRFHNRADCTVVPTQQLKAELERLRVERVRVARRGVDSQIFNPAHRDAALRRQWGCAGDELVVLSVGRIAPEKNLDLFASAAQAMRAINSSIRVVVVGDGPRLTALQKSHPEFHFAGARIGADLSAHYASADAFLFPSITETFGNVVLEAMASGLAVLAYNDAAAHENIVPAVTGLLGPRGDPVEFIRLATQLAQDPQMRLSLGREARRASATLSWDSRLPELEAVLLDVAASQSAAQTLALPRPARSPTR